MLPCYNQAHKKIVTSDTLKVPIGKNGARDGFHALRIFAMSPLIRILQVYFLRVAESGFARVQSTGRGLGRKVQQKIP